jgi:hypothetical protein
MLGGALPTRPHPLWESLAFTARRAVLRVAAKLPPFSAEDRRLLEELSGR